MRARDYTCVCLTDGKKLLRSACITYYSKITLKRKEKCSYIQINKIATETHSLWNLEWLKKCTISIEFEVAQ